MPGPLPYPASPPPSLALVERLISITFRVLGFRRRDHRYSIPGHHMVSSRLRPPPHPQRRHQVPASAASINDSHTFDYVLPPLTYEPRTLLTLPTSLIPRGDRRTTQAWRAAPVPDTVSDAAPSARAMPPPYPLRLFLNGNPASWLRHHHRPSSSRLSSKWQRQGHRTGRGYMPEHEYACCMNHSGPASACTPLTLGRAISTIVRLVESAPRTNTRVRSSHDAGPVGSR